MTTSCSPATPSGSRLVATTVNPSHLPSNASTTWATAAVTCSQLSRTRRRGWPSMHSAARRIGSSKASTRRSCSDAPSPAATVAATAGPWTGASSTNETATWRARSRAHSDATRVLPTPAGPVTVTRRSVRSSRRASSRCAAEERRRLAWERGARRRDRPERQRRPEPRVVVEHRPFELHQLRARFQSELVAEEPAGRPEDLERTGLATRSVERECQLGLEALPQRVPGDEIGEELAHVVVASERQLGFHEALVGREHQLLQSHGRLACEPAVGQLGQRWPPAQRDRLPVPCRRRALVTGLDGFTGVLEGRLQAGHVRGQRAEPQDVPGALAPDGGPPQQAAEAGDHRLQRVGGVGRRVVRPRSPRRAGRRRPRRGASSARSASTDCSLGPGTREKPAVVRAPRRGRGDIPSGCVRRACALPRVGTLVAHELSPVSVARRMIRAWTGRVGAHRRCRRPAPRRPSATGRGSPPSSRAPPMPGTSSMPRSRPTTASSSPMSPAASST